MSGEKVSAAAVARSLARSVLCEAAEEEKVLSFLGLDAAVYDQSSSGRFLSSPETEEVRQQCPPGLESLQSLRLDVLLL